MSKLGTAIAKDIEIMLSGAELEKVLKEIAPIHADEAIKQNEKSLQPDGSPREKLAEFYALEKESLGLNPERDQEFTGRAINTFDYNFSTGDKKITYGWDDSKVEEYMYDNYHGMGGRRGTARFFPEEDDKNQGIMVELQRETEEIIAQHLNQDRVIKVNG